MRNEEAILAGMEFGVDAYNERMGYDLSAPEPCGHHCHSDCPYCGYDAPVRVSASRQTDDEEEEDEWERQWWEV